MKKLLLMGVAAVAMTTGSAAYAATFPNIGADTSGPSLFITFTDSGVTTTSNPAYGAAAHPYDSSDDTYFGVINNSSKAVTAFNLKSTSEDIAGFDGDGINTSLYLNISNNPMDNSGYGGPNAYFTNISADLMSLTVNFITPIAANGGTDIFSLEEPVSISQIVVGTPEPSTWAMMVLGFAGMGFVAYRKRGTKSALSAA
jgi:hypothetical protein